MSKSVFISSTSVDLKEYREAVDAVISRLDMRPINMKNFGSQPDGAVGVSLSEVSKADIFIGIIAQRYGYVPKDMDKSVTEQEYDEAVKLNIPRLMYLLDLNAHWDEALVERDETAQKRIQAFRARLNQNEVRSLFTTPDNLASQVATDLTKFVHKQRRERFVTRILIPVITLLILVIILGVSVYTLMPKVPPIEPATFNVAVAGFIAESDSGMSEANTQILSNELYRNLQGEVAKWSEYTAQVSIWSPAQVGSIYGLTEDERAQNAAEMARSFRERNLPIDIIVYGIIQKVETPNQKAEIQLVPEFYIASQDPELESMLGLFKLQDIDSLQDDDNHLKTIAIQLSKQTRILSFVMQGLVLISVPERPLYENAYEVFTAALNTGLPDEDGKELARILMGNARLGEYNQISVEGGTEMQIARLDTVLDDANVQFLSAQTLKPDYARAYLGQATSLYLSIMNRVGVDSAWNEVTESELVSIEELYEEAREVENDRPLESADVSTKYAFGMGQVKTIRYLRGDGEAWDRAKTYFDQVIADYGDGINGRVREMAAQAHGYIGVLYREKNDFDAASMSYQQAIDLSGLEVRKALFERSLLQMTFDLKRAGGEIEAALTAADEMLDMKMPPRDKAVILFHKGKMLSENDRKLEALDVYESALRQLETTNDLAANSENAQLAAQLWAMIGDIQTETGENGKAINAYQQAMQLDPITYPHLERVIEKLEAATTQP